MNHPEEVTPGFTSRLLGGEDVKNTNLWKYSEVYKQPGRGSPYKSHGLEAYKD